MARLEFADIAVRFAPSDSGEFSGYAVIWAEKNRHNELYRRGAFKRSLDHHSLEGTRPLMLWSHNPSEIIGVWTEVREDDKGLFVQGRFLTEITSGREAYERVKSGAVNGLSIGFRVPPGGETRQAGTRILTNLDLAEVSIVGMPSAGRARITSVRSSGRSVESVAAFVDACRKARCALISKGK
ncbi:HK97 family phage prohead protease [Agrobacterium vitis]|uniref:Phage prohead protease, HK97 family n=2 Tax=Rhizobium/Agrobacterium group TaxID=227290 RepID=B9JSB3_ALLAM|nr:MULTISPECIES: HK97 family phage prohead protease [Rhizobium/Agrobacterium group]MCF1499628.1 HK97 family phage prohead protease [Allorhizobium sp. Av2]ACM35606.1 phage prohead protease, HK97 family [Allorhizobium ampelinum S4]MCM2440696.1 HK97 family phage prohead protease [Agrobacterium vitis]MUO29455.1 HK97 family phage prohead protease [Agrobacterium vitis]MUO42630.1 HK97 family phage prohead protease [Agrobacterium vitis]